MFNKRLAIGLLLLLFGSALGFSSSTQSISITANQSISPMITSQVGDAIVVGSNAELAEIATGGVGTRTNPYIIEGKVITARTCVYIHDTTSSFILRNCEFIFDPYLIAGIGTSAVRFEDIEDGVIENCYVRGGDIAIEFRTSTNCSVVDCQVLDAYRGILIDSSSNIMITESTSFNNNIGIMVVNSNTNYIINNSIYSNFQTGVHIEAFSEDNVIFGNTVGWNAIQNARDNGENTAFTDGFSLGNEWSDYVPEQVYSIAGAGGSTDPFATLLTDDTRPRVVPLFDVVVDVESNDEVLIWTASDMYPRRFQIFVNDELEEDGMWDGRDITFDLDYLTEGSYTISLNVTDGAGNMGTDEVVVTVISFILGGIGTELVMYASGVTMVCFVVVIVLVKKFL